MVSPIQYPKQKSHTHTHTHTHTHDKLGFPGGSDGNEYFCNVGDPSLIPGSGKSPGEGNGNPLQYTKRKKKNKKINWTISKLKTFVL